MGGVLSVMNDRLDDFEIIAANIYTLGQGICLQRLQPKSSLNFKFDHILAYGSWYDIQIIGRYKAAEANSDVLRYLTKGIYLSHGKIATIKELTDEKNLDHGASWQCGTCKQTNLGSLAICEHCYTNKSQKIISVLSNVPFLGLPFSVTNAVLQCGKAAQSNSTVDQIDAGISVVSAVVDFAAAPFIVGSLVKISGKVAAETGIKLTAKTVFCEAGQPLLFAIGEELATIGGIVAGANKAKARFRTIVRELD